ncbi:hypothetical protein Q31a_02860 [Aureliella helgolandensis]|uniref:DUF58 domain-containing protein n=2 Tax=Aureliella helgolandensis TaxID=2527968 RepID=A0A518G070_9BACT|nr:hypothetical protein Q31a_02860 [Aureliella helgolandensis]
MLGNVPSMLTSHDHESLAQLQLLARSVVEGVTAGRHQSPHKGASAEFKEHRQYVRGDETRSIDWKLFGKTDRLFIRQHEEETSLRAMILVDQSGSMSYAGSRSNGLSKHHFAIRLAACLCTLLIRQQDAVGLGMCDTRLRQTIAPRSRTSHLSILLGALANSRTGGETALSQVLEEAASQLKRRGLLVLISDCFDDVQQLFSALRYFRHTGSEVVVFQVWDADELDFPFRQRTRFQSVEGVATERTVDPPSLRQRYLQQVRQFRQQLAMGASQNQIDWISCTTEQDYTSILLEYLNRRHGSPAQVARSSHQPLSDRETRG